jgi:hypothetical protein
MRRPDLVKASADGPLPLCQSYLPLFTMKTELLVFELEKT